jgi:hypothetical protein
MRAHLQHMGFKGTGQWWQHVALLVAVMLQWDVVSESGKEMIAEMLVHNEDQRSTASALLKVGASEGLQLSGWAVLCVCCVRHSTACFLDCISWSRAVPPVLTTAAAPCRLHQCRLACCGNMC